MRVLVTGGAGYIGSRVVRALSDAGHAVLVVDDLSTGDVRRVDVPMRITDFADADALRWARPQAAVHCAALIDGPGSVADPLRYYDVNVARTVQMMAYLQDLGCSRIVLSSSSAAIEPTTPYGWTKAMVEQIVADSGWTAVALRYANVGGGNAVLARALRAQATGDPMTVTGTDWPTRDGSGVRDYVHVDDIARAHVLALHDIGLRHLVCELGSGAGTTVLELLAAVAEVTGRPVPYRVGPRRPGDIASAVADIEAARLLLGWEPQRTLHDVIRSAAEEVHHGVEA